MKNIFITLLVCLNLNAISPENIKNTTTVPQTSQTPQLVKIENIEFQDSQDTWFLITGEKLESLSLLRKETHYDILLIYSISFLTTLLLFVIILKLCDEYKNFVVNERKKIAL